MLDGSYRQAPSRPRFVCLGCEEQAVFAGVCRTCGVERLALSDPAVRGELTAASERRLHARAGREQTLLGAAAFLLAVPLRWLGGWTAGTLLWMLAGLGGAVLLWRLVARFVPRSALYAFRRRRLDAWAGTLAPGDTEEHR